MDLYEVESKIKELEASYNKEADNLMQELNAYKKKNPILPMYGDDPNVDKMIANKNRIIRSQYTRRENKIHKLWEKFYDDVTDISVGAKSKKIPVNRKPSSLMRLGTLSVNRLTKCVPISSRKSSKPFVLTMVPLS